MQDPLARRVLARFRAASEHWYSPFAPDGAFGRSQREDAIEFIRNVARAARVQGDDDAANRLFSLHSKFLKFRGWSFLNESEQDQIDRWAKAYGDLARNPSELKRLEDDLHQSKADKFKALLLEAKKRALSINPEAKGKWDETRAPPSKRVIQKQDEYFTFKYTLRVGPYDLMVTNKDETSKSKWVVRQGYDDVVRGVAKNLEEAQKLALAHAVVFEEHGFRNG